MRRCRRSCATAGRRSRRRSRCEGAQARNRPANDVDSRPLIAHVVYRFDVGGLENGVVNLLNRMPAERYRHAVLALTEVTPFGTGCCATMSSSSACTRPPGTASGCSRGFTGRSAACVRPSCIRATSRRWRRASRRGLRGYRSASTASTGATSATSTERIGPIDGFARMHRPFVTQYVALSQDLERYLTDSIGVPARRVQRIINGVDTERVHAGRDALDASRMPVRRSGHVRVRNRRTPAGGEEPGAARARVRAPAGDRP